MGQTGLKLRNGNVSPTGAELQHLMALWGPAAKPGDRARISDVLIKDDHIRFEINGGPIKKQKWYQRIQIQGANSTTISPGDSSSNARGSFVDLYFDKYVPEMTGPELKDLLRPVFDFDSKSALDAYLETVFSTSQGGDQESPCVGRHEPRDGHLCQGTSAEKGT